MLQLLGLLADEREEGGVAECLERSQLALMGRWEEECMKAGFGVSVSDSNSILVGKDIRRKGL